MKRKILSTILLFSFIVGLFCGNTDQNVLAAESTPYQNYALQATAISSSNETDNLLAKYAIDGDLSTRWSSAFTDHQWLIIDLGSIKSVASLRLYWEAAYAAQYTISWSEDGIHWNPAIIWNTSKAMEETHNFYNRSTRYIKIQCDTRGTQYGISLYEVEVMGR